MKDHTTNNQKYGKTGWWPTINAKNDYERVYMRKTDSKPPIPKPAAIGYTTETMIDMSFEITPSSTT